MLPVIESYQIVNHFIEAKVAKQNQFSAEASPSQYVFSRKLSTIDAVSHFKKAVKHNISCTGKYYVIDYGKAFNFVKRKLMLTKLIKWAPRERATQYTISAKMPEFTNTFCYLYIIFSSRLYPSHHLKHLINKAYQSVASINQKQNLQKRRLQLGPTTFQFNCFPVSTNLLFEIEIKHYYRKIEAVFWKIWCGVSKYTSTTARINMMIQDMRGLIDYSPKNYQKKKKKKIELSLRSH